MTEKLFTHASLFSGIGGFDLAAEWMGWENVFHCEWNEFGQKVLNYYWPNAELFTDITKSDFTKYANTIDILTGGFPCQPYSIAGKRKGKADDRHLWPEMLRAIREIQPTYVVGENVSGLISWDRGLVFHEVQTDLENEGYEVFPFVLPACAANAPHRRDRVWFVAYSNRNRNNRTERTKNCIWEQQGKEQQWSGRAMQTNGLSNEQFTANPNTTSERLERGKWGCSERIGLASQSENDAYTEAERLEGKEQWDGEGQRERYRTRNIRTDWSIWPTQSPLCFGNDGLPTKLDGITFPKWRNESIKAAGNAIVPQVVYQIFKSIQEIHNQQP